MTVKELINELDRLKDELKDKPVFIDNSKLSEVKIMTVKKLINELDRLKDELKDKPVFIDNSKLSEVKIILKDSYNPLDESKENVIGFLIK